MTKEEAVRNAQELKKQAETDAMGYVWDQAVIALGTGEATIDNTPYSQEYVDQKQKEYEEKMAAMQTERSSAEQSLHETIDSLNLKLKDADAVKAKVSEQLHNLVNKFDEAITPPAPPAPTPEGNAGQDSGSTAPVDSGAASGDQTGSTDQAGSADQSGSTGEQQQ